MRGGAVCIGLKRDVLCLVLCLLQKTALYHRGLLYDIGCLVSREKLGPNLR